MAWKWEQSFLSKKCKEWEKENFLPSGKNNPLKSPESSQKMDRKEKLSWRQQKQNQKRKQRPTQAPGVVWSPRAPAGSVFPPRCSLAKGTAALSVTDRFASYSGTKTQPALTGVYLSCCRAFAPERHWKCPGSKYSWPLQDKNQEKTTLKNITHAPRYYFLWASVRMWI